MMCLISYFSNWKSCVSSCQVFLKQISMLYIIAIKKKFINWSNYGCNDTQYEGYDVKDKVAFMIYNQTILSHGPLVDKF